MTKLAVETAADLTKEQLTRLKEESLKRHDYLAAVLAEFALNLDQGEEQRVLLRSKR